jgi:hypothetical protein
MRKCIKCKCEQSLNWYRGPLCAKCYRKRWARNNSDKTKKYRSTWKNRHPEKERARHLKPKSRFTSAKNSAATRGKIWNITFEDFEKLILQPCYYCNNEIGSGDNYGSGLDRINNSIDYESSNVISCCKICNSTRNNYFTIEEAKIAIQAILTFRKLKGVIL